MSVEFSIYALDRRNTKYFHYIFYGCVANVRKRYRKTIRNPVKTYNFVCNDVIRKHSINIIKTFSVSNNNIVKTP